MPNPPEPAPTSRPDRPGLSDSQTLLRFRDWLLLALLLAAGVALRLVLHLRGHFTFDADMADSGNGAIRLLRGGSFSVFMPGQNYNGDLFSLYYLPLHLLFAPSVGLLRIGLLPLTLGVGLALFGMILRVFRDKVWAFAALAVYLFPSSMMLKWTIHPGSYYLFVLLGISLSTALLVRLVETWESHGWSPANVLRALLFGVIGGIAHWAHFSMIVFFAATVLTLAVFPTASLRIAGVLPHPSSACPRGPRAVAAAVAQSALLIALATLTRLLIMGPARTAPGSPPLMAPAAAAAVLLVASATLGTGPLRNRFAPLAVFAGLWLGALPVIWHLHVDCLPILAVDGTVPSMSVFLQHLRSVITDGFPVLFGLCHDFLNVPSAPPLWARAAALAVGAACVAGLPIVAAIARVKGWPCAFGLVLAAAVAVAQVLLFALSQHGWFASNPRYLILLPWSCFIAAGGAFSWAMRRPGWWLRGVAVALLGLVCLNGIVLNFDTPRSDTVGWSGETRDERLFLAFLRARGQRHVSCRFDENGHFAAQAMLYIAGWDIRFMPSDEPGRLPLNLSGVRFPEVQREVDEAPHPDYLVPLGPPSDRLRALLVSEQVHHESRVFGNYMLFYDLSPDILHDMTLSAMLARVAGQPAD